MSFIDETSELINKYQKELINTENNRDLLITTLNEEIERLESIPVQYRNNILWNTACELSDELEQVKRVTRRLIYDYEDDICYLKRKKDRSENE